MSHRAGETGGLVYRIHNAGWQCCAGLRAENIAPWPRLTQAALVVLDLDEIYSDVWRFKGKSDYAVALIEKQVRTQGLVDGVVHIVIHRLNKLPGGFQAFFSAIPLESWQQLTQWASDQDEHCLLMTSAGLLCHAVPTGHGRWLLSDRRMMFFHHSREEMVFGSTQAFSSEAAALNLATRTLVSNHGVLLSQLAADSVEWGVLWTEQAADAQICLDAVTGALGDSPAMLATVSLSLDGAQVETVLPPLAWRAVGQQALNPWYERLAWRAESWLKPVAAVTAVAGLLMAGTGLLAGQMARQEQTDGEKQRAELLVLQDRIQAVSTIEVPGKLLPIAEFSQALDEGARYDPVAFLATLKHYSGKDVRIQRVHLEKASSGTKRMRVFRVDGIFMPTAAATTTATTMTTVTRWVSQMTAAGWQLKALNPASTAPGAFSYEMVAALPNAESSQP